MDSMQKTFKAMKTVLSNIEKTLYLCEEEDVPTERSTWQSTKDQTRMSKVGPKGGSKNKPGIPVSPLILPNGTTSAHHQVVVTSNNLNKSTTTVRSSSQVVPSSLPSASPRDNSDELLRVNTQSPASESPEVLCGITVVPPPKAIFLSRLGVEVTNVQVQQFIKTKMKTDDCNFTVRKMLFRTPRNYSSFVVNIPNDTDLFNAIIKPGFWPELTVVNEMRHFLRPPREYSNLD